MQRLESELEAFDDLLIEPGVVLEISWVIEDLRSRGVVFGFGHGPQCGSLLFYLLGLHGIDPLKHELPFTGFGSELLAKRLHLRVPSRAEQAETVSMLRHYARIAPGDKVDEKAVYVIVGREQAPGLVHEMMLMLARMQGHKGPNPGEQPDTRADTKTFALIAQGKTSGIPLLENPQMRECLRRIPPGDIAELERITAVCRDGAPSGLKSNYLAACEEQHRPPIPHPELEEILSSSANVWLFYEQVVAAVARLTRLSWAEARIICSHLSAESELPREGRVSGQVAADIATACGLPQARGIYLLRLLRQAMAQTVERSALLPEVLEAYRQAYVKAHYPAVFYAAHINQLLGRFKPQEGVRYTQPFGSSSSDEYRDALLEQCREAAQAGIAVLPPDINRSDWGFKSIDRDRILFGLGAIACIDRSTARRIVSGRQAEPYRSIMDIIAKACDGSVNYSLIEPLILSGAMDGFRRSRSSLLQELNAISGGVHVRADVVEQAEKAGSDESYGQLPSLGLNGYMRSEASWAFQRELDVLGCVPSCGYHPDKGKTATISACT